MKSIIGLLLFLVVVGCSSSGSSSSNPLVYNEEVSVSSNEAAALSSLSETIKVGQSSGSSGNASTASTQNKKSKPKTIIGFTK